MNLRLWITLAAIFSSGPSLADTNRAASPSLQFVTEIGHLDTRLDTRKQVQVGPALIRTAGDYLEVSGHSKAGTLWTMEMPFANGAGWTTVWTGDFDGNAQSDLVFFASNPANGRCPGDVVATFLMFDQNGSPTPWVVAGKQALSASSYKDLSFSFKTDPNTHQLALVTTDCIYPSLDQPLSKTIITGVYVARNARWNLAGTALAERVSNLIKREATSDLLGNSFRKFINFGNGQQVSPRIVSFQSVTEAIPEGCAPQAPFVRLPVADTEQQSSTACNLTTTLAGGDRLIGWPTVVLNSQKSRRIVAPSSHTFLLLQQAVHEKRPAMIYRTNPLNIPITFVINED